MVARFRKIAQLPGGFGSRRTHRNRADGQICCLDCDDEIAVRRSVLEIRSLKDGRPAARRRAPTGGDSSAHAVAAGAWLGDVTVGSVVGQPNKWEEPGACLGGAAAFQSRARAATPRRKWEWLQWVWSKLHPLSVRMCGRHAHIRQDGGSRGAASPARGGVGRLSVG